MLAEQEELAGRCYQNTGRCRMQWITRIVHERPLQFGALAGEDFLLFIATNRIATDFGRMTFTTDVERPPNGEKLDIDAGASSDYIHAFAALSIVGGS